MSKGLRKITAKQLKKNEEKKEVREKMLKVFMDIWGKRSRKSEISGAWLGTEPLSSYFHHILPKSKYPQAMFDHENIILLTLNEHEKVEQDPRYYEVVNIRREKLMEKYERRDS